ALIAAGVGLHPSGVSFPVVVLVRASTSSPYTTLFRSVELLPQASIAVHVLVCERIHPLVPTAPSVDVTVGVPQASVAVAVPSAALIAATVGLHPSGVSLPVADVRNSVV